MFLRKIHNKQRSETVYTVDEKARHCANSKTWKKSSCSSKYASQGRLDYCSHNVSVPSLLDPK